MVLDDAHGHGNVKVVVEVDDVAGTVLAVAVGGGAAVVTTAVVVYTALDSLSSFWWSMTFFCSFQSVKNFVGALFVCCLLFVGSFLDSTYVAQYSGSALQFCLSGCVFCVTYVTFNSLHSSNKILV